MKVIYLMCDPVQIGFNEQLFLNSTMREISNFLNLEINYKFAENKFNTTNNHKMKKDIEQNCRDFYKDVYKFCYEKFSITKSLWKFIE